MIESLKQLLGFEPAVDFVKIVEQGAVILDVRSKSEYDQGHINGSINISIDKLTSNLHQLKDKKKPVVTCCASGMRSATAKSILKSEGYLQVYNGGSWHDLQNKIK